MSGERVDDQAVCECEQERFCCHPNFLTEPKVSAGHSLQNADFRTAKQQTGLLSFLRASFYQLESFTCDSAKKQRNAVSQCTP